MFLSDGTIKQLVQEGRIIIQPYNESLVQPCSYDLTLGDVALEKQHPSPDQTLWVIHPGQFVLASTRERIKLPNHIAATVSGKSTWGRRGLAVHITAGHVDPAWDGELTLEMYNHSAQDIELRQYESIAQLIFVPLDKPCEHPYAGRYQGSRGIVMPRPDR